MRCVGLRNERFENHCNVPLQDLRGTNGQVRAAVNIAFAWDPRRRRLDLGKVFANYGGYEAWSGDCQA